uniref:Uncharacterized protein n=1 Tax=Lepeophtheirus salmonis TaxID=72036 RepID=A0A0K2UQA3_LEPSM
MGFRIMDSWFGDGTYDVNLIIFPREISLINIEDVFVVPRMKHGISTVPMEVMHFFRGISTAIEA